MEEDTKLCTNCKREIPAVNFTTHSVHCARNLRTCPACKEPVPVAQLADHHDALHKEVPCKKCGENVCGTDLEDHIRDSCAQTIKPCRYCELELPRRALPGHEAYCGARSEQCPDCREYVMAKYRQLHLDSNHGFIRLDEDPAPAPKPKPNPVPNGFPAAASTSRSTPRPVTEIRHFDPPPVDNRLVEASRSSNGPVKVTAKRNNDQPQINTSVQPVEKVNKELPSRGALKKRAAPPPPPDPRRDHAYASAARRRQREDQQRREQTAYNLALGLPPVLSPAAKLDKLRKMDALHNREIDTQDYKNCLQGRVWQTMDIPTGHVLGSGAFRGRPDSSEGSNGFGAEDLSNLQPMTTAQFMSRFQELQLEAHREARPAARPTARPEAWPEERPEARPEEWPEARPEARPEEWPEARPAADRDRFSEIKSSLRALRRGLNEVTAPYNSAPNNSNNAHIDSNRLCPPSPPSTPSPPSPPSPPADDELWLPCEFCGEPVPADDLVLHQTGCRPDLARLQPRRPRRAPRPPRAPQPPQPPRPPPSEDPVIPCEFCTESLPVYLISEHQERCRQEVQLLYPD